MKSCPELNQSLALGSCFLPYRIRHLKHFLRSHQQEMVNLLEMYPVWWRPVIWTLAHSWLVFLLEHEIDLAVAYSLSGCPRDSSEWNPFVEAYWKNTSRRGWVAHLRRCLFGGDPRRLLLSHSGAVSAKTGMQGLQ